MKEIDYSDLILVDNYEYDIHPNDKGEMMLAFRVGEESCVLPIAVKDLKSMLWFANQHFKR